MKVDYYTKLCCLSAKINNLPDCGDEEIPGLLLREVIESDYKTNERMQFYARAKQVALIK